MNKTELQELKSRLFEAEEALRSIREGEVDSLIVRTPDGEKVFTLKTAEHSYRVFMEAMSEGAVAVESDQFLISYCNIGFAKMIGVPIGNIIGESIVHFLNKNQIRLMKDLFEKAKKSKSARAELIMTRKEGDSFPAFISINYIQDSSGQTFFVVVSDLSAQKETEAVRESENQFRTMAESIPQLAWIADAQGHIFWNNRLWFEYTGKTLEDRSDWGWESVYHPDELPHILEHWRESIQTGKPFEMEFRIKGTDGRYRWFLTRSTPVRDSQQKIIRWFGTNTDIDKQKETEKHLASALQSRDIFLSLASHELKTPITSLQIHLQLTKKNIDIEKNLTPTPEKLLKTMDSSLKQVERLTDLVEDLLDVSRIEAGKLRFSFEEFDLSEVVEQVIENYAHCPVEKDIQTNIIGTWDRSRVEQVFVNLLSNAMKYAESKAIKVTLKKDGVHALFTISDGGPGIPKDMHEKIFNRFERASASRNIAGLGLGLYIVKQIVNGHNGSISLQSDIGKGAQFNVALPLQH